MKFRLKLWAFELEINTPEPVQVSPTDLVTALWSAISAHPMQPIVLVEDTEAED
ncbi:hypothetical protein [Nocardia xishanensis]|uniref:hypothetical protein n=1 Tax=Nocardia xishanensis TaxID=238964 RepID=UPI000A42DE18|nr:hypothetical protein [Nocardia xishanensis]